MIFNIFVKNFTLNFKLFLFHFRFNYVIIGYNVGGMVNLKNVYDILKERGFIEQVTHEKELKELLGNKSVPFYIGFDPTSDSLHAGSFIPLMAASHMQKSGHKPIMLVGGGTVTIGDPSGKIDLRKMMNREEIDKNAEKIKAQISKFLSFEGENAAVMVNNADWLLDLNFVNFMREIGSLFSVNRMLTAECYKQRMETGLTFFEFRIYVNAKLRLFASVRRIRLQITIGWK